MIHAVASIARSRFLDPGTTERVAATSSNVMRDASGAHVSTWNADAFIAEVRAAQGDADANAAIRLREIARMQPPTA